MQVRRGCHQQRQMTPKQARNERLAAHIVRHLGRRNIEALYCATASEAIEKVLSIIPDGSTVTWGGSMTIRDMGLTAALHAKNTYTIFDRDRATTPEEADDVYRKAFSADYYLSSANAISEDGVIVNIDGKGNRVAAITFGPRHVLFVIGLNKVAQTLEAAIARARSTAAPVNAARFDISTPCQTDGVCHNCHSPQSVCNYVHLVRNAAPGRIAVILVGEDLGY